MDCFFKLDESAKQNDGNFVNNKGIISAFQSFISSFISGKSGDHDITLLLNSEDRVELFIKELLRIFDLNATCTKMFKEIVQYIPKNFQYLFDNILNEYPNNALAQHIRKYDSISKNTNRIATFIIDDDLESLKYEAKDPLFNYEMTISTGPNLGSFKNLNLKLLQFSALFGSIRCFRHILMHDNYVDELTVKSAIRGKNVEIIRLCEQMKGSFEKCAIATIESYNDDLMFWLFSNFQVEVPKLDCVVKSGNIAAVRFFIDMGFTEESKNKFSMTSLHHAAAAGFAEICKLLIDAGSDVDAKNSDGKTPLMLAAQHNNEETVKILLSNGASKNIYSNKGLMAKDYANQINNPLLRELLV